MQNRCFKGRARTEKMGFFSYYFLNYFSSVAPVIVVPSFIKRRVFFSLLRVPFSPPPPPFHLSAFWKQTSLTTPSLFCVCVFGKVMEHPHNGGGFRCFIFTVMFLKDTMLSPFFCLNAFSFQTQFTFGAMNDGSLFHAVHLTGVFFRSFFILLKLFNSW